MDGQLTDELHDPEELLRIPEGDLYELVYGMPVERNMGAESDYISGVLYRLIATFAAAHRLGLAFPGQTGYRCFPNDPKMVRRPDASFVARGRLPNDRPPKGFITIAPDLAVEVISPNDKYVEVEEKVADYRSAKVKLIWLITPETKTVLIRRLDGTCAEVGEAGELSGEDVIPGFTCKVADLFV